MTKVVGSYESVVRGASEQVPQQRFSGQHYEQVNMLSDPVHGLGRRQGSVTMDERLLAGLTMTADRKRYARNYREFSFFVAGTEYSLVYQSAERPHGDSLPFAFCLNKDTGKFLNVNIVGGAAMDPWVDGGVSAITSVGQFLVLAGNKVAPQYSLTDGYASHGQQGVAQVRGGAYSRTYTITVRRASDGVVFNGSYTTMASSYPYPLNTSDIPAGASDYQKQVNDRVYAYNSAVTKWIGDALADIQPQNIAQKLMDSLASQGFVNIGRLGGSIYMDNITALTVGDGADGSTFRAAFNELDDPAKLPSVHAPYKVVRIAPKGAEPYYMVAYPENPSNGSWQNVSWKEGPAQTVTPGQCFALAVVSNDGNTLHIAASASALQAASGITTPGFNASAAGSVNDEGGLPYFFGRVVSCLTMFQDRLCIIADGVIFASRTGDYFNWFRKSKLTLADDDPVEMYALGAEDDIIRASVSYNKDLFLFGERKQYAVSGRTPLTPKSAAVSATASERDATHAHPVVLGNLIFYGKYSPTTNQLGPSPYSAAVSQFQLGLFQDVPETFKVSQQLSTYLRGRPIAFAALAQPHTVILRTDGYDYGIYLYNFLDQPGSQTRAFDAWHRWEWAPEVGQIIGVCSYKTTLYVYTLRTVGTGTWVACEQFTMDATLSDRPYLDMQRSGAEFEANTGSMRNDGSAPATACVAATADAGSLKYLGAPAAEYDDFVSETFPDNPEPPVTVGVGYDSYVDLTPPFTRDRNGNAIVNGRLIINRYSVSVAQTGGLNGFVRNTATEVEARVMRFNGRRVGLSNNLPSTQPVSNTVLSVPVARANTEHRVVLKSVTWLPATITAIEWVGQFFNNAQRV
ncbi:tail protein [Ralstonia phage RS-PII-1]|uniref:Tail fibers protein n=1 Tax=Ralstonia phage RS-PII-1 TaxID=1932892 RepID=A0A1L7DQL7_9CAUD|nr:tail protein [Ralstonia phage RS-PII-1]APU00302.1 tail fibers protein [Ralstonia phage RS-PII-1]